VDPRQFAKDRDPKYICFLLFEGVFTSVFKDKRSHVTVEIKVFSLDDVPLRIRILEAQKHKLPADLDPQHWYKVSS
jgi:hypothetical protein